MTDTAIGIDLGTTNSLAVALGDFDGRCGLPHLARGDRREVHILSPHALRREMFDSDPGWIGPKFMRAFSATPDLETRRKAITAAAAAYDAGREAALEQVFGQRVVREQEVRLAVKRWFE